MAERSLERAFPLNRLRLYFFIFVGASGFVGPFLNLFFERQGLNGLQIGWLGTISAVTGLAMAPMVGRLSDTMARPRRLLQVFLLAGGGVYLLIGQQSLFFPIAGLTLIAGLVSSGVEPISTRLALEASEGKRKTGFGSIRLWGSLGWAVTVLLAGYLIEDLGIRAAFWGFAVLSGLGALALPEFPPAESPPAGGAPGLANRHLFSELRRDRGLWGLAAALALFWLTRSGVWQFQNLFLDELGAGEGLIGIASMAGSVVELPGMLLADRFAAARGAHWLLRATFLLYAGMAAFILVVPTIPAIIAMETAGGIAYSFLTVSLALFIRERAPAGRFTTTLALITVTLRGLVQIVAAPLSGLAFDLFGAYWLYLNTAAGCTLGWFVLRRTQNPT